jgi:hypothetical protein
VLRSAKDLLGYKLLASDGEIGSVHDFYFDDIGWTIRYLVADTGEWLPGQLVLLSPAALGQPDWRRGQFPVSLSKHQVRNSPEVDADKPVSRQVNRKYEARLYDYYGRPKYW